MPERQGVLLALRGSLAVTLRACCLLVLVDREYHTDGVALSALTTRTCDLEPALARGRFRAFLLQVRSYPKRNVKARDEAYSSSPQWTQDRGETHAGSTISSVLLSPSRMNRICLLNRCILS